MSQERLLGESLFKSAQELHGQRRYREAEEKYRAAMGYGRSFRLLYMLGVLLAQDARPSEAVEFLEDASAANTRSYEVERELGAVYQQLGRRDDAMLRYTKSISLKPDQPRTLYNLFQLLLSAQRLDVAVARLQDVIKQAPHMATAHHLLANAYFYMGDMQMALTAIREAIRLEPNNGMHYRILAYLKTFTEGDPELAVIENLNKASLTPEEAIAVKFALHKAYDDLDRKDEAFGLLLEANRLMRGRIQYQADTERANAERVMAAFTAETLRGRSGAGDLSDRPIFILGVPRSGTSLVEQILAGHPSVSALGETPAFHEAVETVLPTYRNDFSVSDTAVSQIARRYLAATQPTRGAMGRVTDKMLGNLGYVGLIHLAFPNARFVHVVRNPVDTCLSCYATKFGGAQQPFAYDLYELGSYYRLHEDLMKHWRTVLPSGAILLIRYEDIVKDLRGQTELLLAHVGLDWWEGCLSFEKNSNPVSTASAAQVRRPIYNSSIGRWRPDAEVLSPLIAGLGPYAASSGIA